MNWRELEGSARKTLSSFLDILPIVAGMLLLTSLVVTAFPVELASSWFGRHTAVDVLVGLGICTLADIESHLDAQVVIREGLKDLEECRQRIDSIKVRLRRYF